MTEASATGATKRGGRLRRLVVSGAIWTVGGHATSQVLRLGSNLILTRLLTPELFGLMSLVQTFLAGIRMFSDIGIGPNIVISKHGENYDFLNTAWTVQVLRGLGIATVAWLGSSIFARLYAQPELTALIMVSSLSAIIAGFNSTALHTESRNLNIRRLTLVSLGSQIPSIAVMVVWAWISPSVWALIAGALSGAAIQCVATHVFLPRRKHRFAWHPEALQELLRFGRWIFLSTVLGYAVNHADKLIMGGVLSMEALGIYSVAATAVIIPTNIYERFKQGTLLPAYSTVFRDRPHDFPGVVRKSRMALLCIVVPGLSAMIVFGDDVVRLLYDARYADAGQMLQILSVALLVDMIHEAGPVMLSHGHSFMMTKLLGVRATLLLAGMAIGGQYGIHGILWGIVISRLVMYPIEVFVLRRYKSWFWYLDLAAVGGAASLVSLGFWLERLLSGS